MKASYNTCNERYPFAHQADMGYPRALRSIAGNRTLLSSSPTSRFTIGEKRIRWLHSSCKPSSDAATLVMAAVSFWHLLPHKQLCPEGGESASRGKSLIRILRHFGGFLFITCFLGMMIVGITTFIAAVPTIILIIAQFRPTVGCTPGRSTRCTGLFHPTPLLVFTLTSLLIIYALTWLGIALAYQYASYKVQDEEEKRRKESQLQMAAEENKKY